MWGDAKEPATVWPTAWPREKADRPLTTNLAHPTNAYRGGDRGPPAPPTVDQFLSTFVYMILCSKLLKRSFANGPQATTLPTL